MRIRMMELKRASGLRYDVTSYHRIIDLTRTKIGPWFLYLKPAILALLVMVKTPLSRSPFQIQIDFWIKCWFSICLGLGFKVSWELKLRIKLQVAGKSSNSLFALLVMVKAVCNTTSTEHLNKSRNRYN